jgi:hypothetical protein
VPRPCRRGCRRTVRARCGANYNVSLPWHPGGPPNLVLCALASGSALDESDFCIYGAGHPMWAMRGLDPRVAAFFFSFCDRLRIVPTAAALSDIHLSQDALGRLGIACASWCSGGMVMGTPPAVFLIMGLVCPAMKTSLIPARLAVTCPSRTRSGTFGLGRAWMGKLRRRYKHRRAQPSA